MADYQLTQTGDEVQDILDNSQTGKYFYNQTVATWSSDATYSDYPYKGVITLTGVKGTDGVEVTFSNADATSGNYSPICNTVANGVEIWAKAQDNGLVIPTIHITTGADVQLQGDDAYLPISGGNITGSLSVVGSPVLTTATGSTVGYRLVQGTLATSVTASASSPATIIQSKKLSQIWSSFAVNNIDGIADDKVIGVVFLWTNGNACCNVDTLVMNNLITVTVRNMTSSAVSLTGLRLGIHYETL